MEKEIYDRTQLEVIKFQTEDVIVTSGINPDDEYEGIKVAINHPLG